jgi:hypothetical protein
MCHACIQAVHLITIHLYETLLCRDVLIRFLIQEQSLHEFEEAIGVKGEEPAQELLIGRESYYIINVYSPFERAQCALWEFLPFKEHLHDPHELVPYVCLRVLDLQLLPLTHCHRVPLHYVRFTLRHWFLIRTVRARYLVLIVEVNKLEDVTAVLLDSRLHHHVV